MLQGQIGETSVVGETEAYDLDTNSWRVVANLTTPRFRHRSILLPNGNGDAPS